MIHSVLSRRKGLRSLQLFRLQIILIAFLFVASFAQAQAEPTLDRDLTSVFHGNFACKGEFANGRKIEADVAFESRVDNRWLAYKHVDRAPNRYQAEGYWGLDSGTGKFVMILVDVSGGIRLFSGDGWKDGKVVFERTPTPDQKERKERFRFEKESAMSFRMTYEVPSGDSWKMVDSIVCAK